MTARRTGKQIFVEGSHAGDGTTEATAEMFVKAINLCPLQSFERARAIGEQLHDRWHMVAKGEAPFGPNDMAWGDIVQFVVRMANDPEPIVRKRKDEVAPEGERARYTEDRADG